MSNSKALCASGRFVEIQESCRVFSKTDGQTKSLVLKRYGRLSKNVCVPSSLFELLKRVRAELRKIKKRYSVPPRTGSLPLPYNRCLRIYIYIFIESDRFLCRQVVVGHVDGGSDGGHEHGRRREEQGSDELFAIAVRATDGRGELHVHREERGGPQEPTPSRGGRARHERARGTGIGRNRIRPVGVVHVHHVHSRRKRKCRP